MILTERDRLIIKEISRWRGCLSRHVQIIGGFTGVRACDRRLKKLVDENLLTRKRYVYGLAGIYQITPKAGKLLGLDGYIGTIRLDQAFHDMTVVDTYLYCLASLKIQREDFISEKEIRHEDGFSPRSHLPDFLFKWKDGLCCVEVELSEKAKDRLEKNVESNYVKYEFQYWFVPKENKRVLKWLKEFSDKYPNIKIVDMGVIDDFRGNNKT